MVVGQTALTGDQGTSRIRGGSMAGPIDNRSTGRTRGGCTDGHHGQPQHRPKPWWLYGGPRWAARAQAKVVVVARTAVIRSSGTGQSRGGRTDGRDGRSRHRPKSWWLNGWLANRLAVGSAVGQVTVVLDLSPAIQSRCVWADGCSEQSQQRPKSGWLGKRPLRAVGGMAEVVVVGQAAATGARGTGRSRGGCTDGHDGQ